MPLIYLNLWAIADPLGYTVVVGTALVFAGAWEGWA